MLLDIKTFPDPGLRGKSREVLEIEESTMLLVENMMETMGNAPGVGLAAPQVGRSLRIVVINNPDNNEDAYSLLNPVINSSEGEEISEEGCLSIPGVFAKVKRAKSIVLTAISLGGEIQSLKAEGREAQILQHEIDHLNGVLFWDRIGTAKRDFMKRKYLKRLKASL